MLSQKSRRSLARTLFFFLFVSIVPSGDSRACNNPLIDALNIHSDFQVSEAIKYESICGKSFDDFQVCCSNDYIDYVEDYYQQAFVLYTENWKYIYSLFNFIEDLREMVIEKIKQFDADYDETSLDYEGWSSILEDVAVDQKTCFEEIMAFVRIA